MRRAFTRSLLVRRDLVAAGPDGISRMVGLIGEDMAEALRLRDFVDGDDSCWYRSL